MSETPAPARFRTTNILLQRREVWRCWQYKVISRVQIFRAFFFRFCISFFLYFFALIVSLDWVQIYFVIFICVTNRKWLEEQIAFRETCCSSRVLPPRLPSKCPHVLPSSVLLYYPPSWSAFHVFSFSVSPLRDIEKWYMANTSVIFKSLWSFHKASLGWIWGFTSFASQNPPPPKKTDNNVIFKYMIPEKEKNGEWEWRQQQERT